MRRSSAWLLVIMATIGITAVVAFAASVHLKNKPRLTFTDNTGPAPAQDLTLSASGALTGLGNGDVVIALSASANPTGQCCNPGGECKVPGHNPAAVNVTGVQPFPAADIKNGNLSFSVVTREPETPIPNAPDCPNTSWKENITDLVFTHGSITVFQPAIINPQGQIVDPNTQAAAQSVFAVTCNLSGVDGPLGSACP